MSNRHEDYLDNGTKRIEEFCSENSASQAEREFIVTEYTNELLNNIGDTDKLKDYDVIIYSASARFLDREISHLHAKKNKDSADRQNIINRCERLQEVISVFTDRQWSLPNIKNKNPQRIKEEQEFEENRIREEKERIEREKREQAECAERARQRIKRKEEEARQKEIEHAKKRRRIKAMVSLAIVAMIGLLLLYFIVLAPWFRYNNAVQMIYSGKYDQAIAEFQRMNNYRDSETRIQQVAASRLYDNGDLAGAYTIYSQLDPKYNQHNKEYEAYYQKAGQLNDNGQMQEAFDLYYLLGNYKESKSKAETIGLELVPKYEKEKNFTAASEIYKKLGMSEQAQEATYQYATLLAEQGEYLAASDIWLSDTLIGYKDSRKLNYEMALSLQEANPQLAVQILQHDIEYAGSKQAVYQIGTKAVTNGDYEFAIQVFGSISEYKDSANKLKEAQFLMASQLLSKGEYEKALEIYLLLGNYKTSVTQANECKYQIATSHMNSLAFEEAYALFSQLGNYRDSGVQAKYCMYQIALQYKENGKYSKAYESFSSLGDYRDSKAQANETGYIEAKILMAGCHYDEAAIILKNIKGYEDSEALAKECDYLNAGELIIAGKYQDAITILSALKDYKDSQTLLSKARFLIAGQYEKAGEYSKALEIYQALGDYQGAADKVLEMQFRLGKQKYEEGYPKTALTYLELAKGYSETKSFVLKIASESVRKKDYQTAESAYKVLGNDEDGLKGIYDLAVMYEKQGNLTEAVKLYGAAGSYKDAAQKKKQLENLATIDRMRRESVFAIGNTVIFGSYEQDNNTGNGKEPIEWIVIDQKGPNVLLVSKYAIDVRKYNSSRDKVTWATCSLRTWLNGSFMSNAFSKEQKEAIVLTDVSNQPSDGNPAFSTYGPNTQDQIFLLSYYEVKKYFPTDRERQLENTTYTKEHGAEFGFVIKHGGEHCFWLTRSPGKSADEVVIINESGSINECKSVDDSAMVTRPAFWLNTNSTAAKEAAFAYGSTVVFGHYGDKSNKTYESIRWLVIGKKDEKAMLLAEKVIDNRKFQENKTEGITWEKSDLRSWLNGEFIATAFSSDEQRAMYRVKYSLNSKDGVEGYYQITTKELSDPVFLLSYNDVQKIFSSIEERRVESTSYAKKMGANDNCCWWLLSPGSDNISVAVIDENGKAGSRWATDKRGVRPAIMINLSFGLEQSSN